jgi:protein TonB
MRTPFFAVLFFFTLSSCTTRKVTSTQECIKATDPLYSGDVYSYVPKMPEFPGGEEKLNSYLVNSLSYVDSTRFQGKIRLRFLIDKDGNISNVRVLTKKEAGAGWTIKTEITEVENDAVKCIAAMPKWKPGQCGNEKVTVQYDLPIIF